MEKTDLLDAVLDKIELRFTPEVKSDKGWIKLNNAFPIPAENSYEFNYSGKTIKIKLVVEKVNRSK